jgi:Carboxypeptidase regulatory-like domain
MRHLTNSLIFAALLVARPLSGAVFAGKVLEDHSGAVLRRAEIRIYEGKAAGAAVELETDTEGRFRSPDLPAGDYRLEITKANYLPITARVRARADLVFRMVRYGSVSGRLADLTDQPVLQAQIVAVSQLDKIAGRGSVEDGQGHYRIYGLLPGKYRIAILNVGNRDARSGVLYCPDNAHPREFVVAGGEEYEHADITIPTNTAYSITGKVELPEGVRSVMVSLSAADHPELRFFQRLFSNAGQFTFDRILPGSYDIVASPSGGPAGKPGSSGKVRVTVDTANLEGITIPLVAEQPASTVQPAPARGSIKGNASGPVVLLPLDLQSMRVTLPDDQGLYTFEDLSAGAYYVLTPTSRWMPADLKLPAARQVDRP